MHLKRDTPLIGVVPLIREVKAALLAHPYITAAEACGAARRGVPVVEDVDMVVSGPFVDVLTVVLSLSKNHKVHQATNERKLNKFAVLIDECYFNFIVTNDDHFGAWVLFYTGPIFFNMIMCSKAKKLGYTLRQSGLYFNDVLIAGREERQIFDALGLVWVDPKNRGIKPLGWQKKQKHVIIEKEGV